MRLDSEGRKRILAFLQERSPRPGLCPLCQKQAWNLENEIWELREFNMGNLIVGGQVFPVVPLICTNCGNTLFINAVLSGVLQRSLPEFSPFGFLVVPAGFFLHYTIRARVFRYLRKTVERVGG